MLFVLVASKFFSLSISTKVPRPVLRSIQVLTRTHSESASCLRRRKETNVGFGSKAGLDAICARAEYCSPIIIIIVFFSLEFRH